MDSQLWFSLARCRLPLLDPCMIKNGRDATSAYWCGLVIHYRLLLLCKIIREMKSYLGSLLTTAGFDQILCPCTTCCGNGMVSTIAFQASKGTLVIIFLAGALKIHSPTQISMWSFSLCGGNSASLLFRQFRASNCFMHNVHCPVLWGVTSDREGMPGFGN